MLPVLAWHLLACHKITHAVGKHEDIWNICPELGLYYTVYGITAVLRLGFLILTSLIVLAPLGLYNPVHPFFFLFLCLLMVFMIA